MTTKCKPPKDPQLLETSSHLRFYDSCFTGTNNCSTTTCASTLQGKGPKGPLNRPDRPPHPWKRRRTRPDRSRRSRRSRTTGPRRKTTLRFRQPPVDDEGAPGPHEDERVQARSPFMLKYEDPCDGQPRADSGCGFRAGPVDEFRRLNKINSTSVARCGIWTLGCNYARVCRYRGRAVGTTTDTSHFHFRLPTVPRVDQTLDSRGREFCRGKFTVRTA